MEDGNVFKFLEIDTHTHTHTHINFTTETIEIWYEHNTRSQLQSNTDLNEYNENDSSDRKTRQRKT